jgi:hypothetical protein
MLCHLLGSVLFAAWTTASAEVILFNNRLIQTDLSTPFLPNTREECEDFKLTADALRKELYDAHEECLKNEDGPSSAELGVDAEVQGGRCSKAACQDLHTARHTVAQSSSKGYTQCLQEVRNRTQWDESPLIRSDNDFDYAVQRLKSLSAGSARTAVRQVMSGVIDDVFGANSRFVKQGLQVGTTSQFLLDRTNSVLESCYANGKESIKRECDREVIHTIQTLSSRVPVAVRGDPAVSLIQSAMLEKLNLILGDVMRQADEVQQGISNMETGSTQRRRRSAVIEND